MTFKTKRLLVKFKPCIQDGKFNFENSYSNKKIDILNLQPSDPEHMTFQFYSKEDNTNICHIALTNKRGKLEVSYGTEPFFRNKGYMTEALAFAVKWIFENTTEDSIWHCQMEIFLKRYWKRVDLQIMASLRTLLKCIGSKLKEISHNQISIIT